MFFYSKLGAREKFLWLQRKSKSAVNNKRCLQRYVVLISKFWYLQTLMKNYQIIQKLWNVLITRSYIFAHLIIVFPSSPVCFSLLFIINNFCNSSRCENVFIAHEIIWTWASYNAGVAGGSNWPNWLKCAHLRKRKSSRDEIKYFCCFSNKT